MLILGHRGASADFPENTLPAFAGAHSQRADGVELDVMRCGSGELVVCHDELLQRLAGLDWCVQKTPWWKLKGADVGTALGKPPARIPLLEEVFEVLPVHLTVNVEIKCDDFDDRGLAQQVGAMVEERGWAPRVLLSSFNALSLCRLAVACPSLRRGLLIDPDKAYWPQAYLALPLTAKDSVHPHHSHCSEQRVREWHQRGLRVIVWTVDEPALARQLRDWGVDGVITNRPGALRAELAA